MNDKKIAFIYCVNNRALYEESVRYVKSLHVPEGYEIEFIAIESASSIASGYNQGMRQTDAKYKVYLHQDVFIVNKNFLYDIIALFEKYPKLGMIGVAGAKTVPKNGVWWESTQRFGKVYDSHTGEMKLLSFKDTELDYEPVQAIDGLIMITQYDTPWREDLFTGWHFYDLSQCQEFLLAGYDVGVVRQNEPWCVHDCGIVNVKNGFDDYRKKFIDVYGENVQSLNKKFSPTKNNKLFLVLTLHRSGSSATAGVMNLLGIDMGKNLLPASESNKKGHFENRDFVIKNEQILNSIGASWYNPPNKKRLLAVMINPQEIRYFLSKQVKPFWGLKDPRTLLTLDLWLPYLKEISDITYVFVSRPFEQCVRSLAKRENISLSDAVKILAPYLQNYYEYKETLTKNNEDVISVNFEELIEKPERFVSEINKRLGNPSLENIDKVREFLDKKLKNF
ncbi:glycosyltransferase [Aeribacillus pallidus]|uniref:glycosyltransferase n=1 Tax=Aeribacillus pallidus TaxID=33936 RepID=UPI003D248A36